MDIGHYLILATGLFLGYWIARAVIRHSTGKQSGRLSNAGGSPQADWRSWVEAFDRLSEFEEEEGLLDFFLQEALKLTDGGGGNIIRKNRVDDKWEIILQRGKELPKGIVSHEFWRSVAERVMESGEPFQFNPRIMSQEGPTIPLVSVSFAQGAQKYGAINLWKDHAGPFSPSDLHVLSGLADRTGRILQNQTLKSQQNQQEALVDSLQEVGSLLMEPGSLDEILEALLESLDRVLPFDSASILLFDQPTGVYLAASRGIAHPDQASQAIRDHGDQLILTDMSDQKSLYIPDVRQSLDWISIPGTEYIRSWIGLALIVKGEYIGALNIDHHQVDAYDVGDVKTARAFADQAAIAIENSRLLRDIRISNQRLQVLYELNNRLAETLDPQEIILRALQLAQSALGGEKADYYQYNLERDSVELLRSVGRDDQGAEVINRYLAESEDRSELGWIQSHQQGIRISNVREHELWVNLPEVDTEVRSLITVPVFIDQELSGAISVLHTQEDAFSQEHEELLQAVAQQIGLALNNAGRYREVSRLLELLEAHQQLQDHLFEHLPVGVLLLDHDYRVLSANLQGLSLMDDLQPGFDKKTVEQLGEYPIETLTPYAFSSRTLEIQLGDASPKIFQVQIRQVETTAAPYWVLMISDVTQEVETDRAVQMQQRLATLGQFAAGITHDFNNIISSILVYADILERDPNLHPRNASRISVIREQSQRAADLIGQILDFSRRSVLTREPMDLVPFLEHIQELLTRVLSDQYPVNLSLPEDEEPVMIKGDQTGLQQTLMNLALNARDAMSTGGEISIHVTRFSLDPYTEPPVPGMNSGDWVLIEFSDQGTGISEEDLPHIFEPFYTTKRSKQGTGLGLAQVYGIVKQHSGFIDVESSRPGGTTFDIYLPAYLNGTREAPGPQQQRQLQGREQKILVVEDETSLREALWSYLEESGFRVYTAANGTGGLNILRQTGMSFALIISDVVMPEMGGIEMVQQARQLNPEIPVLFITAHQERLRNHELLKEDGVKMLTKPFSLDELIEVVNQFKLDVIPE